MTDGTTVLQERPMTSIPNCEVCDGEINVPEDVMDHELLSCQDCGTEYEVASTDPFSLRPAPTTGEDWGE